MIDKNNLQRLPRDLNEAAAEMNWLYYAAEGANKEQVFKIIEKLRMWASVIEAMPDE